MAGGGDRHGSTASSGAESFRSQDTIRSLPGQSTNAARTPARLNTEKKKPVDKDSEISPHSAAPGPSAKSRGAIAPWENVDPKSSPFTNYRKDLSVLETSGRPIPNINRQPPTAVTPSMGWNSVNGQVAMPSSVFGSLSFYRDNDSSEDVAQLSPGFRPSTANDVDGFAGEDRRPSVASATTVSSSGSKSSGRGFHKKLQGFFGEDFPGNESTSRQNSESSLPSNFTRNRNNSVHNTLGSGAGRSRPGSPASSRPRTPGPSSEVTPWDYQLDQKDIPTPPDANRPSGEREGRKHHKLHLPGHRHRRSKEDAIPTEVGQPQTRPRSNREASYQSMRGDYAMGNAMSSAMSSKSNLQTRSSSPTPSMNSAFSRDTVTQRSPNAATGKRSLFDRIRGRQKDQNGTADNLRDLPTSTQSLQQTPRVTKMPRTDAAATNGKRLKPPGAVDLSGAGYRDGGPPGPDTMRSREHRTLLRPSRRGVGPKYLYAESALKDPNNTRMDPERNQALWDLDTDLTHMEGIVNPHNPPMTPPVGGDQIYTGWPYGDDQGPRRDGDDGGTWDAPDSWAVKKVGDENLGRLREIDEAGIPARHEDSGPPYFVRIFRMDSTFATLSVPINTTVQEIIMMLGKKTFLQDDIDNYQIILKKHDTSRALDNGERPVYIQKRLLEQAGYKESDRIEEIGRDDNSYLCRFTFLPARMSGYSSLVGSLKLYVHDHMHLHHRAHQEKDPGFSKMQKFSHIDLQGKNLITIPITLYQRATEIISLNLSRNLSLDVPKDFIQSCTNLREIKYCSNEAWRLPASLSLASRLTMLDVSNNRLEQLEHAELSKLRNLISLRLSNNKLTSLPSYFGIYSTLRSLNLSSNSLSEFPDFLCDIRTLVDLDISFNSISSLPKIGQLTSLERLWATNNKLCGSFPDAFGNLINLKEIDIRFNAIDNIDVMARLPNLEHLMVGHNSISSFEGSFAKIRILYLNHNPVTSFGMNAPVPTLSVLNLASAKLSQLPDDLFHKVSGLTKLILDKNHFVNLSPHLGRLTRLEHLSIAKNELAALPAEVGRLVELKYLDLRENNLKVLPSEIWFAKRLETLNVSSNVLDSFPRPAAAMPGIMDTPLPSSGLTSSSNMSFEELGKLEDFSSRRPSQASGGLLSVGSSPGGHSQRKASLASVYGAGGRKPSTISRTPTEGTLTPVSRKDSSLFNRRDITFAGALRHLFLADNRLSDEVFDELALLPELRIVNLSYNELYDMPPRTIRRWQHLTELYLSGNDLTSLPAEDLEEISSLKVLHINSNKFQVLPAELGKVTRLAILDVGNNYLKYNVSNWPYDWNWNWNKQLKYLNLSGNKRLEIKPSGNFNYNVDKKDLTDFTDLHNLKILGLMDVTLMIPSVPDETEDRRIRTSGSTIGSMSYGMADALGRNEHLSTIDMVVPRFRGHEDDAVVGMFDGQSLSSGGSKIAKYLHENFSRQFQEELDKMKPMETPCDALRRTYLALNKDLATIALANMEARENPNLLTHRGSIPSLQLGDDDLKSGSVATVLYVNGMDLYISNVGDAQALLIHSEGGHRIITRKHDPAEPNERQRIREAGGFVSRQGKLNDTLEVSRAFGYVQMTPAVVAAPHTMQITIRESDEMILLASRELWDYLTPDFAVDVARSERNDLMRAAQKLRDLAIAFGATGKIMVMIIGVSDLRKREKARYRTHSMSMGPSGSPDEYFAARRGKRGRDGVADSKLARLDQEVEAPTGDVSLVFTDIKNSTLLWETYPIAMRSAIKMHNEVMRRHLRIIGGYEVKTEGDAFMVAFPSVTSALLWCFTIQSQLLDVQWPQEILNSVNGQEVLDADGNIIFRGLSVRMGIHWGQPVCEVDPVTKRMDYFGPMVNRASRISSVADGGQITVSSDFIAEIQRLLETHIESDRSGSTGSEETLNDDILSANIRRELRSLSSQGFEVKDLGERRLKGLENPEYIYLMYPHSLASRLMVQEQRAHAEANANASAGAASKTRDSQLTIDTENVWDLWNVSLRLEMLCSALEGPGQGSGGSGVGELKPPETALLERMKNRGGEITDRFLINFVEHQISRIESCINTLALRNLVRPFNKDKPLLAQACPISEIFTELTSRLGELERYKARDAQELGNA